MNEWFLLLRRLFLRRLAQFCFFCTTRVTVTGLEHLPDGPVMLAANHLHHLDSPLMVAVLPTSPDILALSERRKWWVTPIVLFYGAILVKRDKVDRSALKSVLAAFKEKKQVLLFPEARISRQGGLLEARDGVGYLALQGKVPVVPIAICGTESVTTAWRQLRRPHITVTITPPLTPTYDQSLSRKQQRKAFTHAIMSRIAAHLPPAYQGYYTLSDRSSQSGTMENS